MGSTTPAPEYSGLDKYPGWIATIITVVITVVFLGALFANSGHSDDHSGGHAEQPAENTEAAH